VSDTGRKIIREHGCYGCGRWPIKFGGIASPPIFKPFTLEILQPAWARFWTDCPDCGHIEVEE
jgi:hypothetical protein